MLRRFSVEPLTVVAAGLALALGLYRLARPSLWVDESFTARATRLSYKHLVSENHWLFYTIEKTWMSVAGSSEWALRLPSVVAAAAACVLVAPLGNRLFGRPVGPLAALLLAVHPFMVAWSQQARGYSALVLLSIVATMLLLRALEDGGSRAWIAYGAAFLLLIVWQAFSAFLLLPVHLVVARRSRAFVGTVVVSSILAVPWLVDLASRERTSGGTPTWLGSPEPHRVLTAALNIGGFPALLPAALIGLLLMRRHARAPLLTAWTLLPFALSLAITPLKHVFVDRYMIVSTPAIALAAAYAISRIAFRPARVVAVGTVLGLTAVTLVFWYSRHDGDNWFGENWRAGTHFVMQHGGGHVSPFWATPAFRYYGGRPMSGGWTLVLTKTDVTAGINFGRRLHAVRP